MDHYRPWDEGPWGQAVEPLMMIIPVIAHVKSLGTRLWRPFMWITEPDRLFMH